MYILVYTLANVSLPAVKLANLYTFYIWMCVTLYFYFELKIGTLKLNQMLFAAYKCMNVVWHGVWVMRKRKKIKR